MSGSTTTARVRWSVRAETPKLYVKLTFIGNGVKAARIIGINGDVYYADSKDIVDLIKTLVSPSMTVDEDGTVWNSDGNAPPGHNRGDKLVRRIPRRRRDSQRAE